MNFDKLINNRLNENIPGGKSEGLTIEDIAKKHKVSLEYAQKQLEAGIKVEMEHTKDPKVAREIAMDHLTEFIDYYIGLKKMEKGLKEMVSADVVGVKTGMTGGSVGNTDSYAPGDTRIPKSLFGTCKCKKGKKCNCKPQVMRRTLPGM